MTNNTKQFNQFLSRAPQAKEVSLAIAEDEKELKQFQEILDKKKFYQANNIFELLESIKGSGDHYLVIDEKTIKTKKEIYGFIIQYPTGQIEIFNPKIMQSQIASPDYQKLATIILITKKASQDFQKENFDILSAVGLTYQS